MFLANNSFGKLQYQGPHKYIVNRVFVSGTSHITHAVCSAAESLQLWFDQPPPRDPSLLRQANLEENCIAVLSTLRPAAVNLLQRYLRRLSLAQALPTGNQSELLVFLGRKFDARVSIRSSLAVQLVRWMELRGSARTAGSVILAWRKDDISDDMLARFENMPVDAQRMVFVDLELRSKMKELFLVPVPERSRFFGQLLDFFSGEPSRTYPVSPPPSPQFGDGVQGPDVGQPSCAEHRSTSSPSKSISVEACGTIATRGVSGGERPSPLTSGKMANRL